MSTSPATPFWEGYRRQVETHKRLIAAVDAALWQHPTQRLGQIIVNALGDRDLFNVYDETLIEALEAACRA